MKLHRIYGIFLRYWYVLVHSLNRKANIFYWPVMDLITWGITSKYITQLNTGLPNIILMFVSGIYFWLIVWLGQYEITINFLDELWNRNLVNIFVSPLKLSEWITSVILASILKIIISLSFASLVGYVLYQTNILAYGLYLIPFALSLILTGWAAGLFIAGIVVRFGSQVETLAWTALAIISPFSAVYYPLSTLPVWAQQIAKLIPTSYIFENGRNLIYGKTVSTSGIVTSLLLNFVYITLAILFFKQSFAKAKQKGLTSLH